MSEKYRFYHPLRVRYNETDVQGHFFWATISTTLPWACSSTRGRLGMPKGYLIEIAKKRGIAALKARTLADNTAVLRLVHKAGVIIESTPEEGEFYLLTYKF